MYFNENEFILNNGRKATGSGIIGLIIGFILSLILSFTTFGTILMMLFSCYLFLTGFWGGYKLNFWFRKFRYRMPIYLWHVSRVFVIFVGILLGIVGYGVFEHFILLLAMGSSSDGPGMIASQIILLPYVGKYYSDRINYDPNASPTVGK